MVTDTLPSLASLGYETGGQGPGAWGVVMTPLRDSVSWEAEDTKASDVTTR